MGNKEIAQILEWIIRHASDWHLSKADIFSIKLATRAYKAWDRAFTEMELKCLELGDIEESKGLHEAMKIMNKHLCEVKINDFIYTGDKRDD